MYPRDFVVIAMRTRTLWYLHLMTLFSIVLWAVLDLQFESLVNSFQSIFRSPLETLTGVIRYLGITRLVMFAFAISFAGVTFSALACRLFFGGEDHRVRSIMALLSLTAVIAAWSGLVMNHADLAWQGKRLRVATQLEQLQRVAEPLRQSWPREDGALPAIGPFMAYPFGRPTTLILLKSPAIDGDELCIAAIERGEQGAIKLQLSGAIYDDWVEWHPGQSKPTSFVDGLSVPRQLKQVTALQRGWYLVRYEMEGFAGVRGRLRRGQALCSVFGKNRIGFLGCSPVLRGDSMPRALRI